MEIDSGWSSHNTPVSLGLSNVQVNNGVYSRKLVTDSQWDGIKSSVFTTTTGKIYKVFVWIYPDDGTIAQVTIRNGANSAWLHDQLTSGLTQDAWNLVSFSYTETAGGSGAYLIVESNTTQSSGTWYIDDVSVKELQTADSTPNGNHGTVYGASYTTDRKGQSNGAMSFDGTDDYVDLGTSSVFNATTVLSASIWVKYGGTTGQHQFYLCRGYDYTNKKGWNLYVSSSGTAELRMGNGSVISYQSFGAAQQDVWVNYAFTYDGSTILTYKNGVYLDSYSLSSPLQYYDQNFHIGNYGSGYNFKGSLSDVRIYDRVLSEDEVKQLYNDYDPKISAGTLNKGLVLDMPLRPDAEKVGNELVANSGNSNTTDWIDSNSDGISDGFSNWGYGGSTITPSIVTGNGFADNAQRVQNANAVNYFALKITSLTLSVQKSYVLTLKYRASSTVNLQNGYSEVWTQLDANTGDAVLVTKIFSRSSASSYDVMFRMSNLSDWFEIDEVSIKELQTADSTPNGNHGTIYGADIRNHGASFDSTSDVINLGDQASLEGMSQLTISAWVYPTALAGTDRNIIMKGQWTDSDMSYRLMYQTDWGSGTGYPNGYWKFHLKTSSGEYTASGPNGVSADRINQWHLITGVYNGSTAKLYDNGALIASTSAAGTVNTNSYDTTVGYSAFYGQIAGVKMYNRALSATEVLDLYQNKTVAGAVLDMPLSDKTGFKDVSGNGNNGTNTGVVIIGEAASFDGTNDYIVTSEQLTPGTSDWTTSGWFYINGSTGVLQFIVNSYSSSSDRFDIYLTETSNQLYYYVAGSGTTVADYTTISYGTWYYFDLVRGGGYVKFYLNGALQSDMTNADTAGIISANEVAIGRQEGSAIRYLNGYVSDVQIYNRALSATEIATAYAKGQANAGSSGVTAGNLKKGLVLDMPLKSDYEKIGTNFIISGYNGETTSGWNCPSSTYGTFSSAASSGNGFSGNVLKYVATSTYTSHRFWAYSGAQSEQFANGGSYRIQFKYRSSQTLLLMNRDTTIQSFSANTDDAATITVDYSPTNITWDNAWLLFRFNGNADDYMEIDDIKVVRIKTADATPNGNHGTVYGATVGEEYTTFDGTNDYINIGTQNIGTVYSFSCWMKLTGTGNNVLLGANSDNSYLLMYDASNNRFVTYISTITDPLYFSTTIPDDSNWHFVSLIRDDVINYLYIDGTLISSYSFILNNDYNFLSSIGQRNNERYFNGSIAGVKIYNRALSAEEVKSLYNQGR